MRLAYMFPGQSSRYPEMIERLLALGPWNGEILDRASEVLRRDLRAHYSRRNEAMFARNRDVQLGVFLANHMHCESLRMAGISADLSLGLSLGEYNHLLHIGALDFDQALRLLEARGRAYEQGPEGAMASVFPIAFDDLCQVTDRVRHLGRLEVAIRNAPRQHVIAGRRAALEAALAILEEEHYIQGVVIEDRIPMHTSLLEPVAGEFRPALESAAWRRPTRPYLPNAVGRFVREPGPAQFIALLSEQVSAPVLWEESIDFLDDRFTDLVLVEVGPRAVLYNLLGKRWKCEIPRYKTDSQDDLYSSIVALAEELSHGVDRTAVVA